MNNTTDLPALTDEEAEMYETLQAFLAADDLPEHLRVGLMRVTLDGQSEAAVVVVDERDEEAVTVKPVALLVSNSLFARMGQP